jgi:cysteine desulfurase
MGKMSFDYSRFDFVSFSGHKIGALQGVGVLMINPDIAVMPLMFGGGQERSYRPGTENILGIQTMALAFDAAQNDDWGDVQRLRDHLENEIMSYDQDVTILGRTTQRTPNTSLITMPDVKSETQVMAFDMENIAVSAGSACSSGKVKMSRAVKAMGFSDAIASSTLRISLGLSTTENEIHQFIAAWKKIHKKLSKKDSL